MRPTVLFLTVLGCAIASPSGYYHQEYNYKTSASSYKNNELQHQTDDQGYYKKDGDLEGRVRPRVDANSEHSEYINPNLRTGDYNTGLIGGANGDMSSYGHMRADVGSYGTHDLSSEGLARTDHIVGTKGGSSYGSYSSGSYGSNSYGSSSQAYGVSSNLRSVTSNIQQELESELQRAIQEHRAYSQTSGGVAELERELRQNLTNRLNTELSNRYGQQSIRGGLSYTISGGRLHSTANYDNQELQDLRRQLENTLLNQLRTQYSQQSGYSNYGYSSSVRPYVIVPYQSYRPVTTVTTVRPAYSADYTRYTPIPNPESITNIASRVQNQLDTRLNQMLDDVQRRYFSSSSSYSLTNTDVVLQNLRNELRNNITYLLNEEIRLNYGSQIPRDGYMYSVGQSGQTSSQYNYSIRDLENLRSQIERNLLEKLNRDFERYRSRWSQQSSYSQSSQSASNIQYSGYNTPRYETYNTPHTTPRYEVYSTPQYRTYDSDTEHFSSRPLSSHIAPLISSGGSSSSSNRYNLLAGSSQAGYEISGSSGSSNMVQLQRQLQQDLSRQLQAAISRGHYGSYSTSGSYNPQSYQTSLQQLSDELNRNLTRQLQEYSASGYYSSYGNFDQTQLANLRSQLQSDLMRQLQQGLQQSYHSSSSYSASSSSSSSDANYRPVRGFGNYQLGQYRSGGSVFTSNAADCVGDDPNAYNTHRMKRSYQPYRSQPIGLSASGSYGNNRGYNYGGSYSSYGRPEESLGQQVDESDLTQQVEDPGFEKLQPSSLGQQQQDLGQQVDDSDLIQQVEDSGFGKLQVGTQGQQVNDLDQQVDDLNSNRLQLSSQNQLNLGQQVDDSDLVQQSEDSGFGSSQRQLVDNSHSRQQSENLQNSRLQLGFQGQVDDSDLTQQTEDSGFGKLQLGSQGQQQVSLGQEVDDSDLTQQTEDSGFGKLQLGSQGQQSVSLGQEVDDSDLTQQTEDSGFGKLHLGSQGQQQDNLEQEVDDSELTQQVTDSGFGKLQLGSQGQQQSRGQQIGSSDLTQQVENSDFDKLRLDSNGQTQTQLGQQVDDSDLTQQVESENFGNPQTGEQVNYPYLTHQVDTISDNLQLTPQNQEHTQQNIPQYSNINLNAQRQYSNQQGQDLGDIQSGSLDNQNYLNSHQIQDSNRLGQQEDNSPLNQHFQTDGTSSSGSAQNSQSQYGQRGYQQGENYGRFSSQGHWQTNFGHHQTYNYLGSDLNQNQKQVVQQLETELSKELKDAVRNYYTISYSTSHDYQSTYQDLLRELERNLTKQLQAVSPSHGASSYSYSYVFSDSQINSLQKQLEDELKLQLQREISNAASNTNSQQTDQEIFNSGLHIQSLDSQRTQQTSDSQGQQQQNNGQLETLDQHVEDNQNSQRPREFSQDRSPTIPSSEVNPGTLSSGSQIIGSQPTNDQTYYNQETDNNQQRPKDQSQQIGNTYPGPTQVDSNQRNQYNLNRPYPSTNLQFGNKPVHTNNFLLREIDQQQHWYPNQDTTNQLNNLDRRPNNLPTLNQIIPQQQNTQDLEETNTKPEPLSFDNNLNQQNENDNQQQLQGIHLSSQIPVIPRDTVTDNALNIRPNQWSSLSQTNSQNLNEGNSLNKIEGHISVAGQPQETTNQGQFVSQSHSLTEAEHDADSLIQALREAQQNRGDQSPHYYSQKFNQDHDINESNNQNTGTYPYSSQSFQSTHQTDSLNQQQNSFQLYLNNQQVQLADQLEKTLSQQLQNAVSQNHYTITYTTSGAINPQSYQVNYDELLKELQQNITKQLEQTFSGVGQNSYLSYSNYGSGSLTQEQREKLVKELQADLSRQLQQNLQITYGVSQQSNEQMLTQSSPSSKPTEYYNTFGTTANSGAGQTTNQEPSSPYGSKPLRLYSTSDTKPSEFYNAYGTNVNSGVRQTPNQAPVSPYGSKPTRFYSPYGTNVDTSPGQTTNNQVQYGQQETLPDVESVVPIEPIKPVQPSVVQNVEPQAVGVKGGRRTRPRIYSTSQLSPVEYVPQKPTPIRDSEIYHPQLEINSQAEIVPPLAVHPPNVETQEISEIPQSTTEANLSWWKRFGNKVRDGATSLKEKIIG